MEFFTSEGYNKDRKTSRYFGNKLDLIEIKNFLKNY